MTPEYLRPAEVAHLLGVSPVTVRKWAHRGLLKGHATPGGHRRFSRAEIDRFAQDMGMCRLPVAGEPLRVLIVEHHRPLAVFISDVLTRASGFEVAVAFDGFEAGRMLQRQASQVLLLDIRLPGLDGLGLCRRLREDPETTRIRIVAITGHLSSDAVAHMERCGAARCLQEPFTAETLLRAVCDEQRVVVEDAAR